MLYRNHCRSEAAEWTNNMKLVIDSLTKSFSSKEVIKTASAVFEQGKIYGLIGRNGAGKTTLFNCINNDISSEAGNIYFEDDDGNKTELTADEIGYVISTPVLPEFLTGYEFVKFYMDINSERIDKSRSIDDYFDMVKLEREDRGRLIKSYSHGMKNKVQMLCFIISRPKLILLDEPLTSFDVVVALEIKKMLREIKSEHIIIFSTHILQLATDLCDEIVILNDGKLEQLEHSMLESKDFEDEIIELLKEEQA